MKIDRDTIAEELGFSRMDIDMLLTIFQENAYIMLDKMEKMIGIEDIQGIKDTAHAISGSAGTLRLNEVYEVAMNIETSVKIGLDVNYYLCHERLKKLLNTLSI